MRCSERTRRSERALNAANAILAVRKSQFEAAEKQVGEELEKSQQGRRGSHRGRCRLPVPSTWPRLRPKRRSAKAELRGEAKEAAKHSGLGRGEGGGEKLAEEAKKRAGELAAAERARVDASRNRELALRFSKRAGEARAAAVDALAAAEASAKAEEAAARRGSEARRTRQGGGEISRDGFSPDGKRLVAGAEDGRLFAWGARDGQQIGEIAKHEGAITQLRFLAQGGLVAAGDGKIERVWETDPGWGLSRTHRRRQRSRDICWARVGSGFQPGWRNPRYRWRRAIPLW